MRTADLELADLFKDVQVRPVDQAVLFHHRDEISRHLFPEFRVVPAHQRLRADQAAGGMIILRLIFNIDLALFDGLIE